MPNICLAIIVTAFFLSACSSSINLPSTDAAAAKEEKIKLDSYDIESTLPSTAQNWKKKPLKVKATWKFPSEGDGPFPVVIYLLSSGGYSGGYDGNWINWFNDKGFATLMVDQYSARGMRLSGGLGSAQSGMSDAAYLSDVYAAIRVAKSDQRIDAKKIVTFGMSWGGGIQIHLMSQWFSDQLGGDDTSIAAHIALGPACYLTIDQPVPTKGKMLMLLGEKDNWNQPGPCIDYAKRLNKAGANVSAETVENAQHAWDTNHRLKSYNVTVYHCDIRFDPMTMDAHNSDYGIKVNLVQDEDAWGKLWEKCSKTKRVTTGGTSKQLSWTRDRVSKFLDNELSF